ncbi:MAG: mechanosensitive ion channel family protein, partial [Candidatus Caldatribacteriaceae bacterium]
IPNGEIGRVANYNRGFTRAIVEIGVAYEADLDRAAAVLERIAREYYQAHSDIALEPPLLHRVVQLGDSSVTLRLALKVLPQKHWEVERDLLYLIKKTFDQEKIEIPYQKQVVYVKEI